MERARRRVRRRVARGRGSTRVALDEPLAAAVCDELDELVRQGDGTARWAR